MKKGIIITIIAVLLFGVVGISQAATGFDISKVKQVVMNVYHDGKPVDLKDPSNSGNYLFMIYNNRTYVPIRFIAETMGADSSSMWSSSAPQNINLNATTPAGFVAQQEYNSLSDKYSALQASSSAAATTAAIRIAELEKAKTDLQNQIDQLNNSKSTLTQQFAAATQKAAEAERQYTVLVNTDNVSYPYVRGNVPSSFTIDYTSFLQRMDPDAAVARTKLLQSDLVTNMLKKYCNGTIIRIHQTDDSVNITGVYNANVLKDVAEIQQVVNQLGFTISFDYTPFGNNYYYPVK